MSNEPIFSMLTGKASGIICVIGDGGCDANGTPQGWVYFYPEGTNGVESGYYSSNSNGDCTTPECFCPYVSGSIYSGSMVNGHPNICDCTGACNCSWYWLPDGSDPPIYSWYGNGCGGSCYANGGYTSCPNCDMPPTSGTYEGQEYQMPCYR
jgi:hypothetical protein